MSTNNEQTVFIVDDETPILDSLTMLMRSVGINTKAFTHAQEFINAYTPEQSGCLLLDIRLPEISGPELHQYLKQQKYPLPVIFITGHGDVAMAVEAIKNGAEDFILKPFQTDNLIEKVKKSLQKECEIRESNHELSEINRRFQSLTPREKETLERIIDGNANKVIAIDMAISQRTVEIHRAHIMQKMQTKSLPQLIKMVNQLGL